MPIGDILLREGWTYPDELESALYDQRIAGKRVCSLLIVRGNLEPDHAARALAEQHGVAAALMKHLDNRDETLAKLLPANIARQTCAIPLGRMRDGEIVICVRDPKPNLQAAFERIVQKPVLITVAAAHSLEPIVDMAYPNVDAPVPEIAPRFARPSSQPATVSRPATQPPTAHPVTKPPLTAHPVTKPPLATRTSPSGLMAAANPPPPPQSFASGTTTAANNVDGDAPLDVSVDDLDSGPTPTFTVVDLDDAGVDKDFTWHDTKTPTPLPPGVGAPVRQPTLPPVNTTRTPAKK